jgi:hypothetical protein
MKITPRPIAVSDEIDKSRDIGGFNRWARSSRTISFIMLILGWFTIPAEVLLRRDFGQRWFTAVNFYAGLFLMLIFSLLQSLFNWVWDAAQGFIASIATLFNPSYQQPESSLADHVMDRSMTLLLMAYVLLGGYHLFKIWWRKKTNTALHSFDDGTSRLEPLGRLLIRPVNSLSIPMLALSMRLIPKKQRVVNTAPTLIEDATVFTDTILEPVALLFLAWRLHGMASLWLFLTAIAVAIHANWKETARQSKILDFRDSMMEANVMRELKDGAGKAMGANASRNLNAAPLNAVRPVAIQYPNLMAIIEEMNKDNGHLSP